MQGKKYGNHCFFFDPETGEKSGNRTNARQVYFQSNLEFKTYQIIRSFVPDSQIALQFPIVVKPSTERFSALHWKVDFAIFHSKKPLFVEVKGTQLDEFKRNVQYFEFFQPKLYSLLCFVADKKVDFPELQSYTLTEFFHFLKKRYGDE